MTILTSQLTKLTVRALRELRDSITKKGKAAPKDSPKRQELRDDYSKVKRAIDKKEQYGKNVSTADKVLDDKKPTPDVDQDDIPVIERAPRAEKGRSSKPSQEAQPLSRAEQTKASQFASWLTTQTPAVPLKKEYGRLYAAGKGLIQINKDLANQIKTTNDPKKREALQKRFDANVKRTDKLRNDWKAVKERGTIIGAGQQSESTAARVAKERRVKLEDIEPLATGRQGREQLGKRQLIKDADRKELVAQVKEFMNYNLADKSGKVTKVPTGKQVTAGAPDDSEGIKDLLNNIQAALATASKVPANPERKSARAQKKFSEATVGQTTSNLRSGGLSALQKIIREEKKKSPRTWKNAVANLKNASVAVQKQAAKLGIINKSAVKTPPKKTKPYKPTSQARKGKPTPTPAKSKVQEQKEAASKARNLQQKSVFNKIKTLTPLIKKNGAARYQKRIDSINKDIVRLGMQRDATVDSAPARYRAKDLKVFKKKGGKVLKAKPKRKVTTVKRKTTAPRKRAALRGYGKALRGF